MSFIKSSIADDCRDCGGTGERITPISIPTSHASYPGYAYDEAVEPCPACAGTGTEPDAPRWLEQVAEEHHAIQATHEHQLAASVRHEKEGSAWIF